MILKITKAEGTKEKGTKEKMGRRSLWNLDGRQGVDGYVKFCSSRRYKLREQKGNVVEKYNLTNQEDYDKKVFMPIQDVLEPPGRLIM